MIGTFRELQFQVLRVRKGVFFCKSSSSNLVYMSWFEVSESIRLDCSEPGPRQPISRATKSLNEFYCLVVHCITVIFTWPVSGDVQQKLVWIRSRLSCLIESSCFASTPLSRLAYQRTPSKASSQTYIAILFSLNTSGLINYEILGILRFLLLPRG